MSQAPGVARRTRDGAAPGFRAVAPAPRAGRSAPGPGRLCPGPGRAGVEIGQCGSSLLEIVLVLALLALLLQALVPELVVWRERLRLQAAARLVVLRSRRLCAAAVASGRAHALVFDIAADGLSWLEVVDGDGDGVRRADMSSDTDPALGGWRQLSRLHPGVSAGLPVGVGPLPGGSPGQGGVALGRSRMAACGPDGSASTGTLYLKNRTGDAAAVRWYGATGRVSAAWRGRRDGSWGVFR